MTFIKPELFDFEQDFDKKKAKRDEVLAGNKDDDIDAKDTEIEAWKHEYEAKKQSSPNATERKPSKSTLQIARRSWKRRKPEQPNK